MKNDNTGQLFFYSNGANVWDANSNTMQNGAGLITSGMWGPPIGSNQ